MTSLLALSLRQLERRLAGWCGLDEPAPPVQGWVRALRDALGMTTRQLARRLGVSQSRVTALEKAEQSDTLTMASLRAAGDALGCDLVYALVPRQPIEAILRRQARQKAAAIIARTQHTMGLEAQAISPEHLERQLETLAESLLRDHPHRLWEEEETHGG